jgi:hypothetical protein
MHIFYFMFHALATANHPEYGDIEGGYINCWIEGKHEQGKGNCIE